MNAGIIGKYNDHHKRYLWIVTNEVAKQVQFALDAWNKFKSNTDKEFLNKYSYLQHMLNHTAIIVKLIEPDIKNIRARKKVVGLTEKCKEQAKIRKSFFRSALSLDNSKTLSFAKKVRNGIEHFDERIDEWYCGIPEGASSVWAYIELGNGNEIIADGKPYRCRRHFAPSTNTLSIFDDEINLNLLAEEIRNLQPVIDDLNKELLFS